MAKLYFRYGAMSSGKSEQLVSIAMNYKVQGKRVVVFSPTADTRASASSGVVKSRNGAEWPSIRVSPEANLHSEFLTATKTDEDRPVCVLVDEAQFLTREQVMSLTKIVDAEQVPVIAFGLKADFRNRLFPGSEALLSLADSLEEIKTVCWYCDRKGFMNLRTVDGRPVAEGEQVAVDGDRVKYVPVCRKCYVRILGERALL